MRVLSSIMHPWSIALWPIVQFFPISIGKLDALRHVLTPSLSFSWSPDFTDKNSPYIQTFADTSITHDYFYGTLAGATPSSESKSVGIGFSNMFQAKI